MNAADTALISIKSPIGIGDADLQGLVSRVARWKGVEHVHAMREFGSAPIDVGGTDVSKEIVLEVHFSDSIFFREKFSEPDLTEQLCAGSFNVLQPDFSFQAAARQVFATDLGMTEISGRCCSYLIEYIGNSSRSNEWHDYFDKNHVEIMSRLPDVKYLASYKPVSPDIGMFPWRMDLLQFNRIAFVNRNTMENALASSIIPELRADAAKFPPYDANPIRRQMDTFVVSGCNGNYTNGHDV